MRALTPQEIGDGKKGRFVFRSGVEGVVESAGARTIKEKGRSGYLERVSHYLVQKGLLGREYMQKTGESGEDYEKRIGKVLDHAAILASTGMNFIELGGGFDIGDHEGVMGLGTVPAVKLNVNPEGKFKSKVGSGDIFGGPWALYAADKYKAEIDEEVRRGLENHPEAAVFSNNEEKRAEAEKALRNKAVVRAAIKRELIPGLIGGSVLDTEFKVEGQDDKVRLGRILNSEMHLSPNRYGDEDVMGEADKWLESSAAMWNAISGNTSMVFMGGLTEVEKKVQDFAKEVNGPYAFLKSHGAADIDDMIAAIGGATGVIPGDKVYLNVPTKVPYSEVGKYLMKFLNVLNANEKKVVFDFFDFKGRMGDRADLVYKNSDNTTLQGWARKFADDGLNNRGLAGWLYRHT
jgi:hypothetical protein